MKISLMLALLLFVLSPGAYGADKAEEKKQGLSTDMSFEDLLVQ